MTGEPRDVTAAAVEQLTATVLNLAAEVWALKEERLMLEALASADGAVPPAAPSEVQPTPELERRVAEARAAFVARVFAPRGALDILG